MKVKIDKEANAAYITLVKKIKKGQIARTISTDIYVYLDLDKKGRLLGIELLNLKALHPDYGGRRRT